MGGHRRGARAEGRASYCPSSARFAYCTSYLDPERYWGGLPPQSEYPAGNGFGRVSSGRGVEATLVAAVRTQNFVGLGSSHAQVLLGQRCREQVK